DALILVEEALVLPGLFVFSELKSMAGPNSSMLYSFLLFTVILSLQEMYRTKLASSELFTILGGFTSSLIFLVLLTIGITMDKANVVVHGKVIESMTLEAVFLKLDYGYLSLLLVKAFGSFYIASIIIFFRILKLVGWHKFIGNFQETCGIKTGWGAVILAEAVALIAAGTVHRVCITTCFLFSVVLLYEINKLSGMTLAGSKSKNKRH
ncbi:Keratinocyte-associated protein 2, partial [Dillenia turbinata]